MKFKLGWWNTHLSPSGTSKVPDEDHIDSASRVINTLLVDRELDVIFLGEINYDTSDKLYKNINWELIDIVNLEGRDGRISFNMTALYRTDKINIIGSIFELDVIAGQKNKIAVQVQIILPDGSTLFVFVVHWPSRLYADTETDKRNLVAHALRVRIDKILAADDEAKIIVIGDFNDEPYDLSLSRYLLASRDAQRVSSDSRLMYNPFWRSLSPTGNYSINGLVGKVSGSYYYRSGLVHRWHTFDQIVFSSTFLGRGHWHLDEQSTTIVNELSGLISNLEDGGYFDHYPIWAAIERQADEPV